MDTLSIPAATLSKLRIQFYGALGIAQALCALAEPLPPSALTDALYGFSDYLAVVTNAYSAAIDSAETSVKEDETASAAYAQ